MRLARLCKSRADDRSDSGGIRSDRDDDRFTDRPREIQTPFEMLQIYRSGGAVRLLRIKINAPVPAPTTAAVTPMYRYTEGEGDEVGEDTNRIVMATEAA